MSRYEVAQLIELLSHLEARVSRLEAHLAVEIARTTSLESGLLTVRGLSGGLGAGGLVFVILGLVLLFVCCRRRRSPLAESTVVTI
ncbi:hypothetical protein BOX15_Mlig017149g9 [Macrostomum lignano]|uniref:Uncharacterized protein n=1 Tax=Macrostomum lignano TaxID=282301 RepID=A0A267GPN0_9PLAT|nr:hypothetical protein BOX15_Mlig017149g9 [Macrostomum lignano]